MAITADTPRPAFDDKLYEDGKHRRYTLLFAVNGGAFAVAELLGEKGKAVVEKLTMDHLAVGMFLFTAVMSFDILAFGLKMRGMWKKSVPGQAKISIWDGPFALPGWMVLGALGLLISAGWLLMAALPGWLALCLLGLLIGAGWLLDHRLREPMVAVGDGGRTRTEGETMQEDIRELILLNEEIGKEENGGGLGRLGEIVAPELAFRRRDGSIVDRDAFLSKANPGQRVTQIESVHVNANRAVVTCRVADAGVVTHNIRLFVKVGKDWRLLGWANEPA